MTTAVVKAEEPRAIVRVRQALDARVSDLTAILPPGMDARRFIRVALLAVNKNPALLECDPASITTSIIEAAQVGLEPTGGVGGAHLVPFKEKNGPKKAQLILDYRGTQHLIREGGGGEVKAVAVFDGDEFEVDEGTAPRIVHRPTYETNDPTKVTHVYAWSLDHPDKFVVLPRSEIDRIRARSRAANNGPWVTDYVAMALKTAVKRLGNYMELRPRTRELLEQDTLREIGEPTAAPTERRSNAVLERIRSKRQPEEVEGEATEVGAQNAASPPETPQDAPEATPAVCGSTSDPRLGEVESCVKAPDHEPPHQSEGGSVWRDKAK